MKNQILNLLEKYGHEADVNGCGAIAQEWNDEKAGLLEILQRHPRYDPARCAIVLPEAELLAQPDSRELGSYFAWLRRSAPVIREMLDAAEPREPEAYACREALTCVSVALRDIVLQLEEGSAMLTQDAADKVNETLRLAGWTGKSAAAGQKVSRAIRLLHVAYGCSEEKGTEDAQQLATANDNCACHRVHAVTVIWLHPLDYLTMSFGHHWSSCHTIDYNDIREAHGDNYSGQYRTGTLSYMMDGASVVMYTAKTLEDAYDFEADKLTRCMMHIAADGSCFVQGRVYPQRQDTDGGLITSFRQIMQDVLAACLNTASSWTVTKGTAAACDIITDPYNATHYKDYGAFSTVTVSRLTAQDTGAVKIRVGHAPLCTVCGEEHADNSDFNCGCSCAERCAYCNDRIRRDNEDAVRVDEERIYCCDYCAGRDNVVYSDLEERWICTEDDDAHYCEYHGDWFMERYDSVCTEAGDWFYNEDAAYDAGYDHDDEGAWYPVEELCYCAKCSRTRLISSCWTYDADLCDDCEEVRQAQELEDAVTDALEEAGDISTDKIREVLADAITARGLALEVNDAGRLRMFREMIDMFRQELRRAEEQRDALADAVNALSRELEAERQIRQERADTIVDMMTAA